MTKRKRSQFISSDTKVKLKNEDSGTSIEKEAAFLTLKQKLTDKQQKVFNIIKKIPCIIFTAICDGNRSIDFLSEGSFQLTGYWPNELVSLEKNFYNQIIHPDDLPHVIESVNQAIAQNISYEVEYRILTKSGQEKWFLESGINCLNEGYPERKLEGYIIDITKRKQTEKALQQAQQQYQNIYENIRPVYDQKGNFLDYEGTFEDITYRRQTEAKLFHSNFYDALTELPNRCWFMNELEKIVHRKLTHSCELYGAFFVDIDGFKRINESLGHRVGDELLKLVSYRLKSSLRETDKIAHFGGDKFVILMTDYIDTLNEIVAIADRILKRFKFPFEIKDETLFIGVSIGVTSSLIGYQKPEEVLRDAEVAMYQAKASGKDCYIVFDKAMQQSALNRLQLESDLRKAIKKQEFSLCYQPIIELKKGKLIGFEALIRWQHPKKGWISPADFIPIAEEVGLINTIGWWVMEEACSQLQQWQKNYPQASSVGMSINLSIYQLSQPDLVEKISQILRETKVNQEYIKLEITESCFLKTIASEVEKVQQIKNLGLGLCIDDFGTGYSSLNRLHEFPIDTLKIDRSFIQRLKSNQTAIIQIIMTLAHTLGMNVVAEGIETTQQLKQLKQLGCESGQGYLFSRPVSREAAQQFLEDNSSIQQYF